ncbi:hypothetical protein L6164_023619 [Bauhinia variegata]|uniref:Uncharacterized protein n=1 Tax=Bauhinia variegata TaxID=167791 RepID=A0ACB9MJ79_BAUVA|nr:hypothetical protein L6164_023619 [Bauhinia variegata]
MEAEMQMMKDALIDILEQLKSKGKGNKVLRDEASLMWNDEEYDEHNLQGSKQGEKEGLVMRTMYDGPQIPFPIFDGSNFCQWRGKCEQYFQLEEVLDAQKVKMILLYIKGKAFSIFKPPNQATKDERRAKGLCMLCGEKWSPYHKASCKVISRVNVIVLEVVEMYEPANTILEANLEDISPSDEEINIFVNAVWDIGDNHTMYLQATIKKQEILMLVDSGSTHNFLSEALMKKLGLSTQYIGPHYATVANDALMEINYKCFMVKWVVQQHEF